MVKGDSFLKTISQLNNYRNTEMPAVFEFVEKPDLTYSVQYFTFVITDFIAFLDISVPKNSHCGGASLSPILATTLLSLGWMY